MQRVGQFKMVLLGDQGVGKSSLALRFAKGHYREALESTIGAAYFTHKLELDQDTTLKIDLWDTAGQERFHSIAPMYYRGAPAGIVVYDITSYESFRQAKMWVREVRQANGPDMVIGLVGNKIDLLPRNSRQVNVQEASEYAEENGLIFMETSASRGDNVTEIFNTVSRQVIVKYPDITLDKSRGTFPPSKPNPKENSTCCMSSNTQ